MEKIKVAIVEQHEFHYEMILPVLLPLLDINCHVDIYHPSNDLGLSNYINDNFYKYTRKEPNEIFINYDKYDLIIFTTYPCYHKNDFNKCGCYIDIANIRVKKILFCHFPEILIKYDLEHYTTNSIIYHASEHGFKWFDNYKKSKKYSSKFYFPIFDIKSSLKKNNQILIIGQINYYRRDYTKLFNLLKNINIKIIIMGRCYDIIHMQRLKKDIHHYNLENRVIIKTFTTYSDFYKTIQESKYVFTALNQEKSRYYTNALTASIMASLSSNTPIIVDTKLYKLYNDINKDCFYMENDDISDILNIKEDKYIEKVEQIKFKKQEIILKNQKLLKEAIKGTLL